MVYQHAAVIQNMAGIDDLIEILNLLPFDQLDNEWVKSSWEKDFVELDQLPIEVQDELDNNDYYTQALKNLQPKLAFWVNYETEKEDEVSFWTILVENDISYRHLIAFLAYLIDTASKTKVAMAKRHAGLLAACSYFQLASISGSGAFKVFNPMLLNQCLDVLRKWTFTNKGDRKRKLSSKNTQKGGRQKCRKVNKDLEIEMDDEGEDVSDDSCDEEQLSPYEINILYNALVTALKKFVKFLQKFSLRGSDSSILRSVQVMCELIRPFSTMGVNSGSSSRVLTFDIEQAKSPVELALIALKQICSSFQGNISDMINIVSKQLMSSILMLGPNNKMLASQNIPVAYSHARVNAVNFVCRLIEEHGEVVIRGVRTLIQHLCVKVPDKTEHRSKVADSVVKMLASFDDVSFAKMIKWIGTLTNTSKVSNRMMGLEILFLLLFKPEKQLNEDFPKDLQIYLSHKHLLSYILSRCSDSASSVRARAINIFSNCVGSENQIIVNACQELFTPQYQNLEDRPPRLIPTPVPEQENKTTTPKDNENADVSPVQQAKTPVPIDQPIITGETPFVNLNFTPVNNNLSDDTGVLSMLKRRTSDEKVFVRKASLQAFESLVRVQGDSCQAMAVDILEDRCRDPSLTVRKQAMHSLSSLLVDLPTCHLIQKAWLNGVLPLILDRESSLQEKCMKCLEEIILYNICPYSSSPDSQQKLMWDLLHIMSGEAEDNLRRYLQRAISQWARAKLIKTSHVNALKTHIDTKNSIAAWMLLAELTSSSPKFNAEFVIHYWKASCSDQNLPIMLHKCVLTVILNSAKLISSDDRKEIIADLKGRLLKFKLPVDIISLTVRTMKTLADNENSKKELQAICHDLLQASDKFLSKVILNENQNLVAEEDTVICHLFTLGEVAQLFPTYVTTRVLLLVQSIIASPCITEFVSKCSQASASPSPSTTNNQESSSHTNSQGLDILSSQQKFSQGSSQGSEPLSQFTGSKWCSRVRGHAFITLGKFCLQNKNLAKKCIAALVRELETSAEEAIRNNVVFILCDLCIRYATLVDQYVSRIAACLNDSSPLIRKQTLTLLTMLIQEDYLKWKGVLFYRFITTLLDEQKEIQEFSEYCLVHCLLARNPNIMFYHFIECIFYFNHYRKHPMYNRFSQDQEDQNLVSLLGKSKSHLRQRLYAFMLQHMTDEQKFNLSAKLNQEILAGVVDGIIPLDTEGVIVLQDTLVILGCKEIKLSLIVNKTPDENMDEEDMAAAVIATAKKNLITQVMKKNVIENIVPIVTSLKHLLETKRSPVLKELMLYLRELVKDFKNEIKEILISDKQLANEIEFDLRKFEEQQKLEELQRQRQPSPLPDLNVNRRMSISCAVAPSPPAVTVETANQSDKSPVNQLVPIIATISLSKQAILNSAKKSLQRIQMASNERRSSLSANVNMSPTNSGGSPHNSPNRDTSRHMSKENTSPVDRGMSRAVSTPFPDRCKNITFGSDQNISLVPPSPIHQNNASLCDLFDSDSIKTPLLNQIASEGNSDIIHLKSPDRIKAPPKIWKITPNKCIPKPETTNGVDSEDPNVSAGIRKIRAIRLSYK